MPKSTVDNQTRPRRIIFTTWIASLLALALTSSLFVLTSAGPSNAGSLAAAPIDEPGPIPADAARWFRVGRILNGAAFDAQLDLIDRAVAKDYNGVLISDGAPNTKEVKANLRTFVNRARTAGLDTIMTVAPFGYCSGTASANDPSLQTGYPMVMPLKVDGNTLTSADESAVPNGDFSDYTNNRFVGFMGVDQQRIAQDPTVDGTPNRTPKSSVLVDGSSAPSFNLWTETEVLPSTQYLLSVRIKAENFSATQVRLEAFIPDSRPRRGLTSLRFLPNGDNSARLTNYTTPNDGWVTYSVAFNSTEANSDGKVNIGLTVDGPTAGKLWFDDLTIKAVPTLNLLKRDSLPNGSDAAVIEIVDGNQTTIAKQGVDFELRSGGQTRLRDPFLSSFNVTHTPPEIFITSNKLRNVPPGAQINWLGWHGLVRFPNNVSCAWNAPEMFELVNAIVSHAEAEYDPTGYLIPYDEIRSGGYEPTDIQAGNGNSATALATSMRRSFEAARAAAGDKDFYMWNDMLDEVVNATTAYYQVRGSLADPGPVPSGVTVLTWDEFRDPERLPVKRETMLGHMNTEADKQIIAAYYDVDSEADVTTDRDRWLDAWEGSMATNVSGAIYTTFANNGRYDLLETFADTWWGDAEDQEPYFAHRIPGSIQAENYDRGGASVAYQDTDAENRGGAYRSDAVDVWRTFGEPGYTVGRTRGGEWLEYTFDVATAETFDFRPRIATGSPNPGSMSLFLDGRPIGELDVENTGGWWNWIRPLVATEAITAGRHVLRVEWGEAGQINFDRINLISATPSGCASGRVEGESGQLTGDFLSLADSMASAGAAAIVDPDARNKYGFDGVGYAEYCVRSGDGTFTMRAAVRALDNRSDSFWIQVDDQAPVLWHMPRSSTWPARNVTDAATRRTATFNLSSGEHRVRFYQRESGAGLDWFEFVAT